MKGIIFESFRILNYLLNSSKLSSQNEVKLENFVKVIFNYPKSEMREKRTFPNNEHF